MKAVPIKAESGRATGSARARRMRAEGLVPGVAYGKGRDATPLAVQWTELRAVIADGGSNALVDLELDGATELAIVYELQRDPVKLTIDHVDFLYVDRGKPIDVSVPLTLVGVAEAVSREGAVVEQQLNELPISAAPSNIPGEIELDISDMTLARNLTVADLVVPDGVTVELDDDQVLAVGKKTRATLALEREGEEGEEGEELGGGEAEAVEAADED